MTKQLLISLTTIIILLICPETYSQTDTGVCAICTPDLDTLNGKQVYTVVEQMPEYPGGMAALVKYLGKNLTYSYKEGEPLIGTILISYIVDANGVIKRECICLPDDRSSLTSVENQALQAIRKMPKWIPGKLNGKNVAVRYSLPIRF
jgi:protein TonB